MINNRLISVLIPAYNASATIEKCLHSLFSQTYSNFEIIFINDGSKDDTFEKAMVFAEKDNRLKVFTQENSGVSSTRNKAIGLAKGDFFCYVDADDTIDPKYLENLENGILSKECTSGLIIQQLKFLNNIGEEVESNSSQFKNEVVYSDKYLRLFKEHEIIKYGFNCGKLFNLKTVRENNIRYNEKISISEDLIFMLEYLSFSDYVHFIEGADYNYITTSYTLGDTKFASFSSEKELLNEYLNKLSTIKKRLEISDKDLMKSYINSGDIFMRLVYSMYRLNNTLPSKSERLKNIKDVVSEYNFVLKRYFLPIGVKEKITKVLLLNGCINIFDQYRLYIRKSQLKRIKTK